MTTKEMIPILADLFRSANAAALAADAANSEDGGTCNLDSPAFRIEGRTDKAIREAAKLAGVEVDDFNWFGGKRWYWLRVELRGMANRRTRMVDAAMKVLKAFADAGTIPGFRACGYYHAD